MVVASAGVSSVAAINGAASVIVIENKTIAEIKSATLNADGSIAVWAEDDQNLFAAAGAASAAVNPTGSLSAAAGVVVVRASNQVKALVGSGAQLNALGNKGDQLLYWSVIWKQWPEKPQPDQGNAERHPDRCF